MAPFSCSRKPVHCEGDRRGPHEGKHHAAQAGAFHCHHWQHLRPQPQNPRCEPGRADVGLQGGWWAQSPPQGSPGSLTSVAPCPAGNWFQMVSAQERLTRTFTRSSHTYTRTERTEISKTRGGETKREVRVEESTQVGGDPFPAVFGDFLGRERLGSFGSITRQQEGEHHGCAGPGASWSLREAGTGLGGHGRWPRGLWAEAELSRRREGGPKAGSSRPDAPHSLQGRPVLRT